MGKDKLIDVMSEELKYLISKVFNIDRDSITNTTELTGGGICFDSIQIILLISNIEQHMNIRMDTKIIFGDSFKSIHTLSSALVQSHRNELIKIFDVGNCGII